MQTPPLRASLLSALRQTGWGFWIALGVYLATRLIALGDFPMYFFTDEAVQTVLAADFLRDGLRNYNKELLPTYFYNVYQYNLSVSVYLQVIPYLLFCKSEEVTRGVPVLFSLIPAVTSGLALKQFFNSRYYWRDTKRKTAREHTLFTDSTLLSRAREDKKVPSQSTFAAWSYKDDALLSERPEEAGKLRPSDRRLKSEIDWRHSRLPWFAYVRSSCTSCRPKAPLQQGVAR